MTPTELSFITVNYRTPELVDLLVNSIREFPPPCSHEIIVVDNNSSDGSSHQIGERHPDIKFIPLEDNIGFGAGTNRGAEVAEGRIIVLINSDVKITRESFSAGIEYLDSHPDVGILGLKIFTHEGELEQSARGFPDLSTGILGRTTMLGKLVQKMGITGKGGIAGRNLMADPDATEPYQVDWVSGALMMIKRQCWEKLGGFDKDYFMYWEDADLCFRALEAGYKTIYYPPVSVVHHQGSSSKKALAPTIRWFHDSAYIYICKNVSPGYSLLRGFAWCALKMRCAMALGKARKVQD